ncbi:MAG: Mrp/NBP35 family ATP-binding protein [Pseudomonadota bacterium]
MSKVSEAAIKRALARINAAGVPLSECVTHITLSAGRVGIALTAPPDATAEELAAARAAATAAVEAIKGVEDVLVAVLTESSQTPNQIASSAPPKRNGRPAPPPSGPVASVAEPPRKKKRSLLQMARRRGAAPEPEPPTSQITRIVAVGSGKGGVGKSTVSINLAVALAELGQTVGLLDADIYGPSVPIITGATGHRPPTGSGMVPVRVHGIQAMSIGFLVDPEKAVVWRAPMATGALGQLLRDTQWGKLDTLIIDMPPGTGDIQLSLAQSAALAGVVLVTTPQDLALADVRKAAAMFASVNIPIVGVVENMSTFICPKCGAATAIFGEGGGEAEAKARGVPFLGRIPLAMAVREASDAGTPIAMQDGPVADAYAAIAANVVAAFAGKPERPFPKITFEGA